MTNHRRTGVRPGQPPARPTRDMDPQLLQLVAGNRLLDVVSEEVRTWEQGLSTRHLTSGLAMGVGLLLRNLRGQVAGSALDTRQTTAELLTLVLLAYRADLETVVGQMEGAFSPQHMASLVAWVETHVLEHLPAGEIQWLTNPPQEDA